MTDRTTNFKIYPQFPSIQTVTNTLTLPSAPVGSILTVGSGGNLAVLPPGTPGQILTVSGGVPAFQTVPGVSPQASNIVITIGVSNSSAVSLNTGTLGGARDLNGDIIQTHKAVINTGINIFGLAKSKDIGVIGTPATSDAFFVHSNIVAKSSNAFPTMIPNSLIAIAYRLIALFKYNTSLPEKVEICGEDRLVLEDDALDPNHLAHQGFDATFGVDNGFIVVFVTQGNIGGTWTWREDTYAVCI